MEAERKTVAYMQENRGELTAFDIFRFLENASFTIRRIFRVRKLDIGEN